MKTLILLLMILGITSCGVYRPSHQTLIEYKFVYHDICPNSDRFNYYLREINSPLSCPLFTHIAFFPEPPMWLGVAECSGIPYYVTIKISSKKDLEKFFDDFE